MNTELTYLYRDASNYKFFSSIVISGKISIADLRDYLYESEYFLPEQVGFKSLVPEQQNEDDHVWHELVSAKETEEPSSALSAEALKTRFVKGHTAGWKV